MKIQLESPSVKISHKNDTGEEKTLENHIEEIKEISRKILRRHSMEYLDGISIINELAETHDVGKLNPEWSVYNDKNPPHSALSAYLYLMESGFEDIDYRIPFYILRHHGLLKKPEYMEGWVRENIIKYIWHKDIQLKRKHTILFQRFIKKLIDSKKNKSNYGSNLLYSDLFGIFKTADILSAKFETNLDVLAHKFDYTLESIKEIIKGYVESKDLEFDENRWKQWVEMAKNERDILLLAPTGWGKTFAAITVALLQKPHPSHIIYVLPTITAIRKMKKSLESLFDGLEIEENYYFADLEKIKDLNKEMAVSEMESPTEIFILKTFLAPITITTLDQVLLSLLNVGKYHLKRYHFRNSFFIFDEYHLYPPNGLLLLLMFVREYNEHFGYNMKSLFMSATEDPAYTQEIEKSFDVEKYVFLDEYKTRKRYIYDLIEKDILSLEAVEMVNQYFSNEKILVLLNTVEKAIKFYLKMREKVQSQNIILLHSRFTYKDRREKEELLEEKSENGNVLFISTQLAEVSLDISFDYLFTEVAPIASLIQRFGRVNRYGTSTSETNVYITYPNELRKREKYPYDLEDVKKVWEILKNVGEVQNEFDLLKWVHKNSISHNIENREEAVKRYFEIWESDTHWLYSLDLEDDRLNKILKYRDTFTTLVIPECMQKEVLGILDSESKIKRILIKDYLTPIPVWWLLGENRKFVSSFNNLIFLGGNRFVYSNVLGYFDSDKIRTENLPNGIPICKDETLIY